MDSRRLNMAASSNTGREAAGADSGIASTSIINTTSTITGHDQRPLSRVAGQVAASEASLPSNLARDRKVKSKIQALLKSHVATLEQQLEEVRSKQAEVDSRLKDPSNPEATVKRHISLLHEFNEIRDVTQGLLGLIAEGRGVRVQDIYSEFGLDDDD